MSKKCLFNGLILSLSAMVICLVPPVSAADSDGLITVMNPAVPGKLAERLPLSPRLDTLEGKTVYLVDNQWGGPEGAYQMFEEMQAWFNENMPSVKTVLRRTEGNMFTDDPALWQEIRDKGDAAIVGTGQ